MSLYDVLVKFIGIVIAIIYFSRYEGNKAYEIRQKYIKRSEYKKSAIKK